MVENDRGVSKALRSFEDENGTTVRPSILCYLSRRQKKRQIINDPPSHNLLTYFMLKHYSLLLLHFQYICIHHAGRSKT